MDLLLTPTDDRDEAWETQFLEALPQFNFKLISPDPQVGPDGFPYLLVETAPDANEPSAKILSWLSEKGIGLAINPQKDYPDFVLSYGMLWFYRESGKFLLPTPPASLGSLSLSKSDIRHAGTPSPQYLPDYVRSILRQFFLDQGVLSPRILVLSLNGENYELAFSAESLGNPPQEEWQGIAEAIAWFLPPHYSLMIVNEANLPEFGPL